MLAWMTCQLVPTKYQVEVARLAAHRNAYVGTASFSKVNYWWAAQYLTQTVWSHRVVGIPVTIIQYRQGHFLCLLTKLLFSFQKQFQSFPFWNTHSCFFTSSCHCFSSVINPCCLIPIPAIPRFINQEARIKVLLSREVWYPVSSWTVFDWSLKLLLIKSLISMHSNIN